MRAALQRVGLRSYLAVWWTRGGGGRVGGLKKKEGKKKRGEGAALHFRMLVVPAVCRRIRSQKGRALSPTALVIEVRDDI